MNTRSCLIFSLSLALGAALTACDDGPLIPRGADLDRRAVVESVAAPGSESASPVAKAPEEVTKLADEVGARAPEEAAAAPAKLPDAVVEPPQPDTAEKIAAHVEVEPPVRPAAIPPAAAPRKAPTREMIAAGKKLFRSKKCHYCHAIKKFKMKTGPNLRGIAKKLSIDDMNVWIRAPKNKLPETLMPAWDGTDDQLEAVIAYIRTL